MESIDREVIVVVSTSTVEHSEYDDPYDCNLESDHKLQTFTLDEFISQSWVMEYLKSKGLYSKEEIHQGGLEYLDKFTYRYKYPLCKYFVYTDNIKNIGADCDIEGVYQEVIGPERLKAFAKWEKEHDKYLQKQEDKSLKTDEKNALRQANKLNKPPKILSQ
jgi:hypothetical protein